LARVSALKGGARLASLRVPIDAPPPTCASIAPSTEAGYAKLTKKARLVLPRGHAAVEGVVAGPPRAVDEAPDLDGVATIVQQAVRGVQRQRADIVSDATGHDRSPGD
jgi:hypothetical protein